MTSPARKLEPPQLIVWAIALNIVNAVGGIIFTVAWPGLENRGTMIIVSLVLGALLVGTAWFLGDGSRWGAIGNMILNAFNILLAVPGFFDPSGSAVVAAAIVSIALSSLVIALILSRESRAFWRGHERALAV